MSDKPSILIQLDSDPQPSSFDRVVAVDAGVDRLFSYGGVTADQVEGLVHGAIFTRGPKDLKRTAIFIGGSDVDAGEAMLERVTGAFVGPLTVSAMMDANGSNTTAAAAVLAARRHLDLSSVEALVLAGTGPVGRRAARLLGGEGARVHLASRSLKRAQDAAESINRSLAMERVVGCETSDDQRLSDAVQGVSLIIAAGAAGVKLLPAHIRTSADALRVAIDLNAVPPVGLEGVDVTDNAEQRDGCLCYGAIGVGGTKMKIHKAAIRALFETNDRVLDAEAIYELGKALDE